MKGIILSVSTIISSVFSTQAQFQEALSKKIEKKTKQKVEQRIDNKIDKGLDKGLDKVEDPDTYKKDKSSSGFTELPEEQNTIATPENPEQNNNSGAETPIPNVFKSGDKSKVLTEYSFQHNVLMEMESVDKKGKSNGKNNMKMLFNESGEYFGGEVFMDDGKGNSISAGFTIFDWKNNQMIRLIDNGGMKIGVIMKLDEAQSYVESTTSTENEKEVKFRKTGKTKTILGYLCEEYIIEDEESTTEMWMTKDVDLNLAQVMGFMGQNQKGKKNSTTTYPKDAPQGFMMETITTNKKNNEKSIMKVIEVNKNKSTSVKTSGYTFM
ncbi:MAG: DUF4412 domain-containing protein [Flavobacteriales bacterium]